MQVYYLLLKLYYLLIDAIKTVAQSYVFGRGFLRCGSAETNRTLGC